MKILAQRPTHIPAVARVLLREGGRWREREGERETGGEREGERETERWREREAERERGREGGSEGVEEERKKKGGGGGAVERGLRWWRCLTANSKFVTQCIIYSQTFYHSYTLPSVFILLLLLGWGFWRRKKNGTEKCPVRQKKPNVNP